MKIEYPRGPTPYKLTVKGSGQLIITINKLRQFLPFHAYHEHPKTLLKIPVV